MMFRHVCRVLPLMEDRLAQPFLEADLAEPRVAGGNQRALAELGPEIPRVRVNDNLARVVARGKVLPDQVIEPELLGTGHFNRAIHRLPTATLATALATSSAAIG